MSLLVELAVLQAVDRAAFSKSDGESTLGMRIERVLTTDAMRVQVALELAESTGVEPAKILATMYGWKTLQMLATDLRMEALGEEPVKRRG